MMADDSTKVTRDRGRVLELSNLIVESLSERKHAVPENLTFLLKTREDELEYKQIGVEDGYVNYIYRISGDRGKDNGDGSLRLQSVVVKWARSVPRSVEADGVEFDKEDNESAGAIQSLDRNERECKAVMSLEGVVPGSTATIYWLDEKRHFFIMEDLSEYITLRQQLTNGDIKPEVFRRLAQIFARLHSGTNIRNMTEAKRQEFLTEHANPTRETLDMIFFEQIFRSDQAKGFLKLTRKLTDSVTKLCPQIFDNEEILRALKLMKAEFWRDSCLLHNDPHPGSFLVNPKHDVRLVDMEFTTTGSYTKDIGYILGEVVMFYYVYCGWGDAVRSERLRDVVSVFLQVYLDVAGELIDDREHFFQYVAGFTGHFIGLRTVGLFFPFVQFGGLEVEEANCLLTGIKLMKEMESITTLDKFLDFCFAKKIQS